MTQDERSERSRALILETALELFSHRGYRATSIRDIAAKANVSTGSVYHHFKDKEELFDTLLGQFREYASSPEFPLFKAFERGVFPDHLEEVGRAAREVISRKRAYVALIYVDVVEFEGKHMREFYRGVAAMCERFLADHRNELPIADRLRAGVPPVPAMIMTIRIFIYYFVVELLFGVPNHYGLTSDEAIAVISDILQHGMVRTDT